MEEKRKLRVKKGSKLLHKDVSDPNDPEALDPKLEWKPPVVSRGASGGKDNREKNEKKNAAKRAKQPKKVRGDGKTENTLPIKKSAVNRKKRSKAGSAAASKMAPSEGEEKSTQPDGDGMKDEQTGPVRCVMCPRIFQSLKEMQAHYLTTHKSKRTKDLQTRIDELKSATDRDLNKLEVDKSQIEVKEKTASDSDGDSKCPVCSIAFKSHSEVTAHVNDVHSYVCSECGSVFYNLFLFTSHKCSVAGKKVRKTKKLVKSGCKNKKMEKTADKVSPLENGDRIAVPIRLYRPILPKPIAREGVFVGNKTAEVESDAKTVVATVQIPKHHNVQVLPTTCNALPLTKSNPTELKDPFILKSSSTSSPVEEDIISSANHVAANAFADRHTDSGREGDAGHRLDSQSEYKEHSRATVSNSKSVITGGNTLSQCSNSSLNEDSEPREGLRSSREDLLQPGSMSQRQLIEKKIAEITKNPDLSVTWLPSLSYPSPDKKEYMCGRCKICCISSKEFMDHIKECLTTSDVSMKPIDYPPKRILRLRREPMVKGFLEAGSNDKYSINPNLIKLLQAVMHKRNGDVGCHDSPPAELSQPKGVGQSFADLLEDDCSSELYKTLDTSIRSTESGNLTGGINESTSRIEKKFDKGEESFDPCFSKGGSSHTQSVNKGPPPMVMIPIASAGGNTFGRVSNTLLGSQKSSNIRELYTRDENIPASPLGSLLSADDIKMEVEFEMEEVAEI